MTARDLASLRDLWLLRYLTTAQFARLHFSHIKLAQRRLRQLHRLHLVDRLRAEAALPFGDRRWVYRLSRLGAAIVAEIEQLEPWEVMPPTRPPRSLAFLSHHERLTDFRIWLREACLKSSGAFSCRFVPAYEETRERGQFTRRAALPVASAGVRMIPDGVFSLDHQDGQSALFLLEVDRGTEPLRRRHGSSLAAKLALFRAAFDEGLHWYSSLFDHGFTGARMLWVAPCQSRVDSLLRLAQETDIGPLVWATKEEEITQTGSLGAKVWHVAASAQTHSLDE